MALCGELALKEAMELLQDRLRSVWTCCGLDRIVRSESIARTMASVK